MNNNAYISSESPVSKEQATGSIRCRGPATHE